MPWEEEAYQNDEALVGLVGMPSKSCREVLAQQNTCTSS